MTPARPSGDHLVEVTPAEARAIQEGLRHRVRVCPLPPEPATVGGVDVSIKHGRAVAAVAVLSYPDLVPLEEATAATKAYFPYVPGLLAFREGPAVLAAVERLKSHPQVLIFDAHGLAHPRRMGLAAHLGVLLDVPAVGCAKSRLIGAYEEPGETKGSWTYLIHDDEVIGAVVRTRDRVRPVFVSVGHRADLSTAVSLVLGCCGRYRLPEPTRWAHRVAGGATMLSRGTPPRAGS